MTQLTINYSFDASAKTVTFSDFGSIEQERIIAVKNLTTNAWIYKAIDTDNYGGSVATNVLTFDASNSGMDDTDILEIFYWSATSLDTQKVDGSAVIQPVSAASLPLPSGASTEAKQDTGNTSLATIAGKDFATQTTLATRLSESDFDTKIGSLTETAPATDTASSGLNGRLQRIAQRLTSLIGLFPTSLGQKTKANSLAVTIASDQDTMPVSAASLPLPSGAATETTLGTRLSESDFDTKIGSLTETAPATDTASSGLNGRLQRIAQRITSLIALFPTSLGQKTKANSFAVTIASDQDALTTNANLNAGTNLIGKVAAVDSTDTVYNGTTALTPKYAILTTSSSGNTSLVAAVTGKKIRVLAYNLMANGTVNVKFQSNTTDISALSYLVANTGKVCGQNKWGWFETASGVALNFNLSAAVAVSVEITYVEV